MKKIGLLAIICYFLIAPFGFHPDTKLTLRYPALENGKVWDIYGYIDSQKLDIPDFHYPPAHFWWLKIHYQVSKFMGGLGFDDWLVSSSSQASFSKNILRYNLAAKFPLLILGIFSGWIIFSIVKKSSGDPNKAKLAAMIWYFNPITIYSLVIMGQNDIVAIFLFLLGMLLYKKWWLAIPIWALASGVKSYPIIWAVMFMLVWENKIVSLVGKIIFLFVGYGLILLPWLDKSYFVQSVLNSGLSQRMFMANIPIGFDKNIVVVPFLLSILCLKTWVDKRKRSIELASYVIFQSCLVILAFSHFNPQWMLWTVPFLAIWMSSSIVNNRKTNVVLMIFICWFLLTLGFNDRFLTWGLLTPINPALINFPSLVEYIKNKGSSMSGLINLVQSGLAGLTIWYLGNKENFSNRKISKINIKNWLILIPWLVVCLTVFLVSRLKTNNVSYASLSGDSMYLVETIDKIWEYETIPGLKYFEISLDNPGLDSLDRGILVVSDNKGNSFEKEFSAFNAGANSWLRVDVPIEMFKSTKLNLETKNLVIDDGLLKIHFDNNNNWAVNFYNKHNVSTQEIVGKLLVLWWWWSVLAGLSFVYVRVEEDKPNSNDNMNKTN